MIKQLKVSDDARVFFGGDVHGEASKLKVRLIEAGFDFDQDKLILLGDLIDKGSDSLGALRLVNQDWIEFIEGNHEQAALEYLETGCPWTGKDWMEHGGDWFFKLNKEEKAEATELLHKLKAKCSRVIEVEQFGRRYIGSHADINLNDWCRDTVTELSKADDFTSRRDLARYIKHGKSNRIKPMNGVEAVFHGHTPFDKALNFENRFWLDTAAYKRNGSVGLAEITQTTIKFH